MRDATQDRHRCHNPACRRRFALVYYASWYDVQIPLAMACPRCGSWDVVMVPTGALRETQGTWVLPLDHGVASLET